MSNGDAISMARTLGSNSSTQLPVALYVGLAPTRFPMAIVLTDLFDIHVRDVHNDTRIVGEHPLEIVTPVAQWSYAVSTASRLDVTDTASARVAITARVNVISGQVGVGWTRAGRDE